MPYQSTHRFGVLVYSEDLRIDFDTRQTYMGVICGNFTRWSFPSPLMKKSTYVFAHVQNWKMMLLLCGLTQRNKIHNFSLDSRGGRTNIIFNTVKNLPKVLASLNKLKHIDIC